VFQLKLARLDLGQVKIRLSLKKAGKNKVRLRSGKNKVKLKKSR
jgi:hypothetical protein